MMFAQVILSWFAFISQILTFNFFLLHSLVMRLLLILTEKVLHVALLLLQR